MKFLKTAALIAVAIVMAFLMIAGLMALTGQTCPHYPLDTLYEYAEWSFT